jgi:hypothetical protein
MVRLREDAGNGILLAIKRIKTQKASQKIHDNRKKEKKMQKKQISEIVSYCKLRETSIVMDGI